MRNGERPGKEEIVLQVTTHRTFWHELAHAAHRHADIADFLPHDERKETVAYREAVAELTAAVLGEMYGEPCVGTSYRYLTKYYDDPLFGITQALRVFGKVLEFIVLLADDTAGEEAATQTRTDRAAWSVCYRARLVYA